ncbi:MAG: hypothetical protein N3B13_10220 [Deltaproteobacteria bacterium]|nr:hypothetical protein [Deltaproteobacteria bacterium]
MSIKTFVNKIDYIVTITAVLGCDLFAKSGFQEMKVSEITNAGRQLTDAARKYEGAEYKWNGKLIKNRHLPDILAMEDLYNIRWKYYFPFILQMKICV